MMRKVELIYDTDCPNVEAAREQLRRAFHEVGQPANWQEWNRAASSSPEYARQYGSPTILVDGQDVTGALPQERADSCRVYRSQQDGFQRVPSVDVIAAALRKGARNGGTRGVMASRPSRSGRCDASEPHVSGLLACLCGAPEFHRLGFPDTDNVPAAAGGRFPLRGGRVPRPWRSPATRLRALSRRACSRGDRREVFV